MPRTPPYLAIPRYTDPEQDRAAPLPPEPTWTDGEIEWATLFFGGLPPDHDPDPPHHARQEQGPILVDPPRYTQADALADLAAYLRAQPADDARAAAVRALAVLQAETITFHADPCGYSADTCTQAPTGPCLPRVCPGCLSSDTAEAYHHHCHGKAAPLPSTCARPQATPPAQACQGGDPDPNPR